jgi:predicted AlkP superfamily phosphohydrolase/phosphomutase
MSAVRLEKLRGAVRSIREEKVFSVDWAKTRAYTVGLNSLYLNVAGREGKGIVTAETLEPLLEELKTKLPPKGQLEARIKKILEAKRKDEIEEATIVLEPEQHEEDTL